MAIGTTAAALGAAAIGTVGNLAAGSMQAGAARDAAAAQAKSAQEAAQVQRDAITQTRIDSYPWVLAGASAMYQYMDELGIPRPVNPIMPDLAEGPFGYDPTGKKTTAAQAAAQASTAVDTSDLRPPRKPMQGDGDWAQYYRELRAYNKAVEDRKAAAAAAAAAKPAPAEAPDTTAMTEKLGFQETPGYQFQVEQGERGVLNNLAALGMKNSGAALKSLTRFRTGLANQEYNNYLNRIAGVAGMGQSQVQSGNNTLMTGASNIGTALQNEGAARASGYVGAANAWGNAIGGATSNIGSALGYLAYQPQNSIGGSFYGSTAGPW